jgi:hypothetical protein
MGLTFDRGFLVPGRGRGPFGDEGPCEGLLGLRAVSDSSATSPNEAAVGLLAPVETRAKRREKFVSHGQLRNDL